VKVLIRNPDREVDVSGALEVSDGVVPGEVYRTAG
jgi:hypothetical protein